MKAMKRVLCFVMALAVMLTTVSSVAEAKSRKTLKTKTVKVADNSLKIIKTKKKVKKVKICSKNKNFGAYCMEGYNKRVYIEDTDYNAVQAVKVYYKDGSVQKYKIKTVLSPYAKKVVDKLNLYLVNPDEGVRKIASEWEAYNREKGKRVELWEGTIDEYMEGHTDSQKKVLIVDTYLNMNSTYDKKYKADYVYARNRDKYFKQLYQGKFRGVCMDGARIAYDIFRYLGMETYCVCTSGHEWCIVRTTDKNGALEWEGANATSYAYAMKGSLPKKYFWDPAKDKIGATMSSKVQYKYWK